MSLLPWIDEDKLDIVRLCMNTNPKVLPIILKKFNQMNYESWRMISDQEFAKDILSQYLHLVYNYDIFVYNKAYGYIIYNNKTIAPQDKLRIIHWDFMCLNETPEAMHILKENQDRIVWDKLSRNPMALDILIENYDKIVHEELWCNSNLQKFKLLNLFKCKNLDCYTFVKTANMNLDITNKFIHNNFDLIISKIDYHKYKIYIWNSLENYNIIKLFVDNPFTAKDSSIISDKKLILNMYVDWSDFSLNPYAIPLLRDNIDKINWTKLCMNPAAIGIIKENLDKINSDGWSNLSSNPNAIKILKDNIDKIDWKKLCKNDNSYKILKNYPEKIDWNILIEIKNEAFKDLLKQNLDKIDEENLIEVVLSQRCQWKIDMIMDISFIDDDYTTNDIVVEFLTNASTELEFKFIKSHFDEDDYIYMLGENPNIFI